MTTLIKTKSKKTDNQTNIDKREAANITEYLPENHHSKIHIKNACKMSKINMFKIDVRTFLSPL